MYFFVGKMMVLQPDREHRFIGKDEQYHDMLPAEPGLWVLRQPNEAAFPHKKTPTLAAMANGELADAGHAAVRPSHVSVGKSGQKAGNLKGKGPVMKANNASKGFDSRQSLNSPPSLKDGKVQQASVALVNSRSASSAVTLAAPKKGKPAATLREAVMDLMNYPHPLDTLGDPGAYGPDGAISRYHNPDHYCRAIGGVLRLKTKPLRMNCESPRWYLHLQDKEQAMKRKVTSMRHARHESKQKYQPPPCIQNEWKRASQHAG